MLLEIIFVLMVLLLITLCYIFWNLTIKTEMLEDWITTLERFLK